MRPFAGGLPTAGNANFRIDISKGVSHYKGVNVTFKKRWDGKLQGNGSRYGMAKDWSQDNMFWYNKKLFDQAGVVTSEHPQHEQVRQTTCPVAFCPVGGGHDVRSLPRCGYLLHDEDRAVG